MAGDWIKMRMDLPDDPAVYKIAAITGQSRIAVIGHLYAFWSWADKHAVDGRVDGATSLVVDDVSRLPGFADALVAAKWLEVGEDFIAIPKHERHNGESAKERGLKNARQARWRGKKDPLPPTNVDAKPSTQPSTREEKRREEKIEVKTNTSQRASRSAVMPPGFDEKVWTDFLAIRKAKRAPLTDTALAGISREAEKAGLGLEEAMRTCCERGWQGFNAEWLSNGAKTPDYSSLLKGD